MTGPDLDSPFFKKAWEKLLNGSVFQDNRTHLFWRKISDAVETFCRDLWSGTDDFLNEEFTHGASITGAFHSHEKTYYQLRLEVRKFEFLYLQNQDRSRKILGLLLLCRPGLMYDVRFIRRADQVEIMNNLTLPNQLYGCFNPTNQPMVAILKQYHRSLTQDYINHVLRPSKQKFPRGRIEGASSKMKILGVNKLRNFTARPRTQFDEYYHFGLQRMVPNFSIPPLGRDIRVTDLKGNPICIGRRAVRRGRFRLVYKKSSIARQKLHGFQLLDECFPLLEKHLYNQNNPASISPISMPELTIEIRHKDDFQAGNFSRFPEIWLILIASLNGRSPENFEYIDLTFGTAEEVEKLQQLSLADQLVLYKKRVYHLVHSGYGIVEDTFNNRAGTSIDGRTIRSEPVREGGKIIGYRPDCGQKQNSDYMSLYSEPFVSQIQKWVQNESLIPLQPGTAISQFLGDVQIFKSTIEPKKPRVCLNARPLAGVLKKLPCKLNQVEELLPHLTPGSKVIISDDSSGFLHVFMSPAGQRLCGIHLGDEEFAFRGMPFGVPSAPSIYQSLNNVISTLFRQYRVANCLYIDDRALVVRPGENYLAWLLPALCTASGHYLSIHKANLDKPADVFTFLGFEIDIIKQEVRVPPERKEKIRNRLREIISKPICEFNALEKMRGKLCSLALICPLTRLYIREITHILSLAEKLLQPEVIITPDLIDELNVWLKDPLFLDTSRPFCQVGEIDLDFRPRITTPQGVIEYHTDSSGYRLGVYNCQTGETYSRQLSLDEVSRDNIAVYEAKALVYCIQNLDVFPDTRLVRIHCDNLICCNAFADMRGCRNSAVNKMMKILIAWQRIHKIGIEIVYIPTAENNADAPSREILFDELAVENRFLRQVEKDFKVRLTLDGASNFGCLLEDYQGRRLPYCSRYHDGANSYRNFLSLRFDQMTHETIWLFCPKNQEHHECDNLMPLLSSHGKMHKAYKNQNFLSKAVQNRHARARYPFFGLLHVYLIEAKI